MSALKLLERPAQQLKNLAGAAQCSPTGHSGSAKRAKKQQRQTSRASVAAAVRVDVDVELSSTDARLAVSI